MLRMDSTNTNYSASSVVEGENIASFSAGVNTPGDNVYFSINVNNLSTLQENLNVFKADFEDFVDTIIN